MLSRDHPVIFNSVILFCRMEIQFSFAQFNAKRRGERLLQSTGLFDCKGNCTLNVALNDKGNCEFCSPNLWSDVLLTEGMPDHWSCFPEFLDQSLRKTFYRIYSINRPGRLLNFWPLRVGAYSRWALIRGWALIKFSTFSASVGCVFCNKTINGNKKTRRCNKARFL